MLGEAISEASAPDDVIVSGSSGSGIEIFCLAARLKEGQRLFLTTALGAMGYGLPGVIGACLGTGAAARSASTATAGCSSTSRSSRRCAGWTCRSSSSSLNNDGYASIRTSQSRYFGRLAGADATSGVTLPSLRKVVEAFELPYARIDTDRDLAGRSARCSTRRARWSSR